MAFSDDYFSKKPTSFGESYFGGGTRQKTLAPQVEEQGEFSKGFEKGMLGLKGTGYGAVGLVGSGLKALTPDVIEPEAFAEMEEYGLGKAREQFEKAEQVPMKVGKASDIESFDDFGDWAAGALGEAVPSLATAVVGGGVGGMVAKAGIKKGVKELAKKGIQKKVPSLAEKEAATQVAKRVGKGATIGAAGTSVGMGSGGTFAEIEQETGEKAPGTALAFGTAAGLLDVLPVKRVFDQLGIGDVATKGIKDLMKKNKDWKKVAKALQHGKAIGGTMGQEAATEGVQELINKSAVQWVDENQDFLDFSREDFVDALNAAAAGAVGGGVLGGVGSVGRGTFQTKVGERTEEDLQAIEEAKQREAEKVTIGEEVAQQPTISSEMLTARKMQEEIDRVMGPEPGSRSVLVRSAEEELKRIQGTRSEQVWEAPGVEAARQNYATALRVTNQFANSIKGKGTKKQRDELESLIAVHKDAENKLKEELQKNEPIVPVAEVEREVQGEVIPVKEPPLTVEEIEPEVEDITLETEPKLPEQLGELEREAAGAVIEREQKDREIESRFQAERERIAKLPETERKLRKAILEQEIQENRIRKAAGAGEVPITPFREALGATETGDLRQKRLAKENIPVFENLQEAADLVGIQVQDTPVVSPQQRKVQQANAIAESWWNKANPEIRDKLSTAVGYKKANIAEIDWQGLPPRIRKQLVQKHLNVVNGVLAAKPQTTESVGVQTPVNVQNALEKSLGRTRVRRMIREGVLEIADDPTSTMAGSWDGQKMSLNPMKMGKEDPVGFLLHEGEHAGLDIMLGDSYDALQTQFDQLLQSNDANATRALDKANRLANRPEHVQRERMAYFIQEAWQRQQDGTISRPVRNFLKQALDAVKAWWRQTNMGQTMAQKGMSFELTDGMAVALAKRALNVAENVHGAAKSGLPQETFDAGREIFSAKAENYTEGLDSLFKKVNGDMNKVAERLTTASMHPATKQLAFQKGALHFMTQGELGNMPLMEMVDGFYDPETNTFLSRAEAKQVVDGNLAPDPFERNLNVLESQVLRRQQNVAEMAQRGAAIPQPEVAFEDNGEVFAARAEPELEGESIMLTPDDVSKAEEFRRLYQDKWVQAKKFQKELEARKEYSGKGPLEDQEKIYDVLGLVPTKTYSKKRGLQENFIDPQHRVLIDANMTIEDADEFVYARTAPEVNQDGRERRSAGFLDQLKKNVPDETKKKINSELKQVKALPNKRDQRKATLGILKRYIGEETPQADGTTPIGEEWAYFEPRPSGMTDQEAQKILDKYQDNKEAQKFGELFDAMNKEIVEELADANVISEDEKGKWLGNRNHYASLRREGYEETDFSGLGKGMFVAKGDKSQEFSPKRAVNVFTNTLAKAEIQLAKAEKNRAMNAIAKTVQKNPETFGGKLSVRDLETTGYRDETGFVRESGTKAIDLQKDVVFWDNGQKKVLRGEQDSPTAKSFVRSLNNLDATSVEGIAKLSKKFGDWQRYVFVSLSPYFMLRNVSRDLGTALYNIGATDAPGARGAIVKNFVPSLKALAKYEMTSDRTSPEIQEVQRFMDAGGRMGWVDSFKNTVDNAKAIAKRQRELKPGSPYQMKAKVRDFLESLNSATENATRLATFSHLVKSKDEGGAGMSDQDAARVVQDLTTNFARKGERTSQVNAWYLFANAALQGQSQILINAKANKATYAKMILKTFMAAFVLDQMNRSLSEEDEEGNKVYDQLPGYVKENNIVIHNPLNAEEYLTIPAPWGFGWFWNIGRKMSEAAANSEGELPDWNAGKAAADTVVHGLQSFMPIYSDSPAQLLMPTVLDPVYQIGANENAFGGKLYPEKYPGDLTPQSQVSFRNTPEYAKTVAQFVNKISDGNEAKSGTLDVPPEIVEMVMNMGFGGNYQLVKDITTTLEEEKPGVEKPKGKVPFKKIFVHEPTDNVQTALYHERISEILSVEKQLKYFGRGPDRDPLMFRQVKDENAPQMRMIPMAKNAESQLRKLRKQRRAAETRGNEAMAERIQKEIKRLQKKFNSLYLRRLQ